MNTRLRELLVIVLCVAMLVSIAACGDSDGTTDGSDTTTTTNNGTTEPNNTSGQHTLDDIKADVDPAYDPIGKYEETVSVSTIHMANDGAFWFPEGDDISNNIYTRTWKDTLNVEYSFLWTSPGAQAEERFNIMMTSKELPDMMAVNRKQFEQLYKADLLEDITDDVVEYASKYTKTFLTGGFEPLRNTAVKEDRLYGIPNGFSYQDASNMVWIRVDWLENLGLELPTNFSELEEVMRAFVEDDPDMNEQDDTYAFSYSGGSQGSWQWGAPDTFFHMFDAYPNIYIREGENGLQDGLLGSGQREKARSAVVKLKEYYEKGFIDPDYLTFDDARYQEDLVSGRVGVVFGGVWEAYWPLILHLDIEPEADWAPIQIPGADGQTSSTSSQAAAIVNINVVTKGFENPEALVKMSNLYHDLNNNAETMKFSEYNTMPEDNNQIFLAYPLLVYNPAWNYEGYQAISHAYETGDTSVLSEAYKLFYDQAVEFAETGDPSGFPAYRSYTSEGSLAVIEQNILQKKMKFNEYTDEPTQHMMDNFSPVKTIYDETVVSIISGNADISKFDEFMTQFDELYYNQTKEELDQWFADNDYTSIQEWFEEGN